MDFQEKDGFCELEMAALDITRQGNNGTSLSWTYTGDSNLLFQGSIELEHPSGSEFMNKSMNRIWSRYKRNRDHISPTDITLLDEFIDELAASTEDAAHNMQQLHAKFESICLEYATIFRRLHCHKADQERLRALRAPIRSLPPEILSIIFRWSVPDDLRAEALDYVWSLCVSSVCKVWRDIAVNDPALWQSHRITFPDVKSLLPDSVVNQTSLLKMLQARSATRPMSLTIAGANVPRFSNSQHDRLIDLSVSLLPKYRHLTLNPVSDSLLGYLRPGGSLPHLQKPFPHLLSLSLHRRSARSLRQALDFFANAAPQIETLHLAEIDVSITKGHLFRESGLKNLKSFTYDVALASDYQLRRFVQDNWAALLAAHVGLREASLRLKSDRDHWLFPPSGDNEVLSSDVESLSIEIGAGITGDISCLLHSLKFPRLRRLSFKVLKAPDDSPAFFSTSGVQLDHVDAFLDFDRITNLFSSLSHLVLIGCFLVQEDAHQVLSVLTNLQSFQWLSPASGYCAYDPDHGEEALTPGHVTIQPDVPFHFLTHDSAKTPTFPHLNTLHLYQRCHMDAQETGEYTTKYADIISKYSQSLSQSGQHFTFILSFSRQYGDHLSMDSVMQTVRDKVGPDSRAAVYGEVVDDFGCVARRRSLSPESD